MLQRRLGGSFRAAAIIAAVAMTAALPGMTVAAKPTGDYQVRKLT